MKRKNRNIRVLRKTDGSFCCPHSPPPLSPLLDVSTFVPLPPFTYLTPIIPGIWCCYPVLWALFTRAANRETAHTVGPLVCCWKKSGYLQVHKFQQVHLPTVTLAFLWGLQEIPYVRLQTFCIWTSSSSYWKVSESFSKPAPWFL